MTDRWQRTECAEYVGVAPTTWSAYVARGQAPAPVEHVGRTPLWDADEVRTWHAERPGRGNWTPRTRPR